MVRPVPGLRVWWAISRISTHAPAFTQGSHRNLGPVDSPFPLALNGENPCRLTFFSVKSCITSAVNEGGMWKRGWLSYNE